MRWRTYPEGKGYGWREIPAHFAPWHTDHDRYARWLRDGTWAHILAALLPAEEAT